jgi:outer membrane protein assembly factor BamB
MERIMKMRLALLASVILLTASTTNAENWPGWRGPRGDGSSNEPGLPTEWDGTTGKNIAWKSAIPGEGHASPIIWDDSIFLVSCLKEEKERILLRLDRKSGKIRWQKTVVNSQLESKHNLNSYASSTPATDGKLVYVAFLEVDGSTVPAPNAGNKRPTTPGQVVVAAYDFDGEKKWQVKVGSFISVHGFCSSPVVHGDLVIVNGDHDGKSYVVALNKTNGKEVWKVPRRHGIRSYVTPLIRKIDGKTQMVMSGSKCVISLDPLTGKRLWNVEGPTEQFVASMVYDGTNFFMACGFPTYHVLAINPRGTGDVTKTHVTWHVKNARCYVPSPVHLDGYLFVADDRGTGNCFNAKTGDRLWQDRLGKHYSASLVTGNGHVYFQADDGIMKVVKPDDKLNVVAENKLGEYIFSSPAIAHGQIFLRAEKHLYAIGNTSAED